MKRLILLPLLCILFLASCSQEPPPAPKPLAPPPYDAAVRDGSVVFWEGGLLVKPIFNHTGSDITHAAIILYNGREPFVYEAVPPCVHKMPLAEYRQEMAEKVHGRRPFTWFTMQPTVRYTTGQLTAMKKHAESQLGRPYMLRGWWKGHEVRGIFCSQFVGNVLDKSGRIEAGGVHESPGSLHDKLLPSYEKTP